MNLTLALLVLGQHAGHSPLLCYSQSFFHHRHSSIHLSRCSFRYFFNSFLYSTTFSAMCAGGVPPVREPNGNNDEVEAETAKERKFEFFQQIRNKVLIRDSKFSKFLGTPLRITAQLYPYNRLSVATAINKGDGDVSVEGCCFESLAVSSWTGGAITLHDGTTSLIVKDSFFDNCKAIFNGGAISSKAKQLTISGSFFTRCEATDNVPDDSSGGCVYCEGQNSAYSSSIGNTALLFSKASKGIICFNKCSSQTRNLNISLCTSTYLCSGLYIFNEPTGVVLSYCQYINFIKNNGGSIIVNSCEESRKKDFGYMNFLENTLTETSLAGVALYVLFNPLVISEFTEMYIRGTNPASSYMIFPPSNTLGFSASLTYSKVDFYLSDLNLRLDGHTSSNILFDGDSKDTNEMGVIHTPLGAVCISGDPMTDIIPMSDTFEASATFTPSSAFTPSNTFSPARTKPPDPDEIMRYNAMVSGGGIGGGFSKEQLVKEAAPAMIILILIIVGVVLTVYYLKKKIKEVKEEPDPPDFDSSMIDEEDEKMSKKDESESSYSYYTYTYEPSEAENKDLDNSSMSSDLEEEYKVQLQFKNL